MAFVDGTVVNIALSVVQSTIRAMKSEVQWVVEAYPLLLRALLPTVERWATRAIGARYSPQVLLCSP